MNRRSCVEPEIESVQGSYFVGKDDAWGRTTRRTMTGSPCVTSLGQNVSLSDHCTDNGHLVPSARGSQFDSGWVHKNFSLPSSVKDV
jgi:hypothetical protein